MRMNRQRERRSQEATAQRIVFTWVAVVSVVKRWQEDLGSHRPT